MAGRCDIDDARRDHEEVDIHRADEVISFIARPVITLVFS
jgi:hypothetical protein